MAITGFTRTDGEQAAVYDGAAGVHIVTVGERVFVYTASFNDYQIVIDELFADGTLARIGVVPNATGLGLSGVAGFASAEAGGETYLYAAGEYADAITVFRIGADGLLTPVQTILDSSDPALELNGATGEMTIARAGGNQFLIAQGYVDDGLSVFRIGADGTLTNTANVDDTGVPGHTLNGVVDTAFAEFGGTSFVFAAGQDESGVSVFSLSAAGALTLLSSVSDGATTELSGASSVETAVIGGVLYLFVGGRYDDGISVFTVSNTGLLTPVHAVADTTQLALNGVRDIEVFEFGGSHFLAASGQDDDGLSLFSIGADGSLTPVDSIFDSEDALLHLDGVWQLAFVEVDGQALVVASAFTEDGITVLQLNPDTAGITGTSGADILVGTERGEEINGLQGNDVILGQGGDDEIDAGEGDDLASGGDGNDRIDGDGDLTQTASDVVTVTETGQDLALTVTLPDSSDGSTIEISGIVNRVPQVGADYNIVYVIDNSGSMDSSFTGSELVGDLNGDGSSNTLVDGTIAAFQSLNRSLVEAGFGGSDVAIVTFDSSARTIYTGSALGGVNDALATMDGSGGTNFEAALTEAIAALGRMGSGQNIVYFISDGEDNGSAYLDEVQTLINASGLNATISAFGLGNAANMVQLDFVDDATDNDSALLVLEPSTLTGGLAESPVDLAEVDRLEIRVNGTLVRTVNGADFVSTPLGLRYDATISGLSTTAGDRIEVTLVASDTAGTAVSVALDVPNADLDVGNDTLIGGDGNDTLNGNGGDDRLLGESGEDLLVGDSGHDLLDGGSDDDRIFGGSGDDTMIGGEGADLMQGGVGDDVYYVDADDIVDESTGGAGDFDTIATRVSLDLDALPASYQGSFEGILLLGSIDARARGNAADNRIDGNSGDNLMSGRDGDDTMNGAGGSDSLYGGLGEDVIDGGSSADTLYGGGGDDSVVGGSNRDLMYGGDQNDTLRGGTSLDTLYGGSNNDRLYGEDGDDLIFGGSSSDTVYGGADDDTIDGGSSADTLYGGTGADSILGDSSGDLIYGGDQNDTMRGGTGNDSVYGGSNQDRLYGDDGNDSLFGGSSSDRLYGGLGDDTMDGGSSADSLYGGDGADSILGGSSGDLMQGGDQNDTMRGGTGNDSVYGGSNEDRLYGDDGDDSLFGDGSSDTVYGGDGNDLIDGGSSADRLYGGSNSDTIIGGSSNDTLYGGGSSDTLTGGTGSDVFVFDTGIGASIDVITDFNPVEDTIRLEDSIFAGLSVGALGASAFVANLSGAATSSSHRVIYETDTGALWFDQDGTGAGARVQFATLGTGLALTAADFLVV